MKKDNGSNAPLISVIIPVYNVEEYLVDCLEFVKRNVSSLESEVSMT